MAGKQLAGAGLGEVVDRFLARNRLQREGVLPK